MTITIGQLRAITHDLVLQEMSNAVYNSSAGFRQFYKNREVLDGGFKIGSPVIIGGVDSSTGGWYTGSTELVEQEKDDLTRAEVDWKQVYESVVLSKLDIMRNSGKSQILQLLSSKIQIAKKRLNARLASGVFSAGTDPLAFEGLQLIIGSADYAGLAQGDIIDEAGANAWLAYQKTSQGALTLAAHQLAMGEASEDEDKPDWVCMRQNVYNELWALLQAEQRILSEDTLSGQGHDAKKVLIFNGLPHYVDSHMKAQSMYFINNSYTKLYVHSMEDMAAQRFDKLEKVNAVKERMLLTGNVFCNNRRANSSIEGITVAS